MTQNTDLNSPLQDCPWDHLEKTFGPANVKWCEQRVCSVINEPLNAWSNLPYIIIGLLILTKGFKKQIALSTAQLFKRCFGLSVTIMGLFSFTYHATNNFLTQTLDFIGMYFYVYLLFCTSLYLLNKITLKQGIKIYSLFILASTIAVPIANKAHFPFQIIIVLIALAIIYLQAQIYQQNKFLYPKKELSLSLLFFIIAVGFSYLDVSRKLCVPESSIFQGHAYWHIISSLGIYFSYRAFLSQITYLKKEPGFT